MSNAPEFLKVIVVSFRTNNSSLVIVAFLLQDTKQMAKNSKAIILVFNILIIMIFNYQKYIENWIILSIIQLKSLWSWGCIWSVTNII